MTSFETFPTIVLDQEKYCKKSAADFLLLEQVREAISGSDENIDAGSLLKWVYHGAQTVVESRRLYDKYLKDQPFAYSATLGDSTSKQLPQFIRDISVSDNLGIDSEAISTDVPLSRSVEEVSNTVFRR